MQQYYQAKHFLPSGLRALILASGYWVLSLPLTTVPGSAAAAMGCLLACFLVDARIHRPPLRAVRQAIIVAAATALMAGLVLLSTVLTRSVGISQLLTPMLSFQLAEVISAFAVAAGLAAIMRSMAHRSTSGKVLEILFVASAFVIALAAHRQGMIHRPYFIGDFAQIRGIDPSSILMAIGAAAVLSLSALLMMEHNHRRLPYHFTALGLLCFSLLGYVQYFGVPSPTLTDDLGLTGQAASAEERQSDNPFRDGTNDPEDREAPVAIVLFRDDYDPDEGIYYFRESAYSQFNGSMLSYATNPVLDQDLMRNFTRDESTVGEEIPARDKRREVRTTVGMLTPHRSPFGLDTPARYRNVANPNSLRFQQTYDAVSLVPEFEFPDLLGRETGASHWSLAQWEEYLEMPDDPRYGELAEELTSDIRPEFADDPYARAMAIKEYLDRNGIYSLENEHAYAEDPAASFLFGDLTGYCIHFAFAATYMYRSIDIPARVGIGYAVPSENRAGGSSLLVQAVNGHAWPEIYLDGLGWVIVDPTPAQTLVDMSVDPQDGLQQMLGDMLRGGGSFEQFSQSQQQGGALSLQQLLRSLAFSIVALVLAAYIIRAYRLVAPRFSSPHALHRSSYRAALDQLAAHGIRRHFGESRDAFARRIGERVPVFGSMTEIHLAQALGQGQSASAAPAAVTTQQSSPPPWSQWQALQRQLNNELAASSPWWRRALALIHPAPWLRNH